MGGRRPDRHRRGPDLQVIPAILVCCGAVYNLLAIVGALKFRGRTKIPSYRPAVSILKPVRGRDAGFYDAILSHAVQQYPEFELLFGFSQQDDPALQDIERLRHEYPAIPIRAIQTTTDAPNGKVGSLEILAREAKHGVLLVNDGDIVVEPDYLARVVGLLEDPGVGLVTGLYRARGDSMPAATEALGIVTEFIPSVLVARLLSSSGFALGATMAFRATDLAAIGGFASIRGYLADDYQLGARIAALGKRIALCDSVVVTNLGAGSWRDVWNHQVRWSRTIRVSRPAGYLGYLVTQATFWCVVAALMGHWKIALAGEAVRLVAALAAMSAVGDSRLYRVAAVPLRDLFGFAVWCGGMVGSTVEWRGLRFHLRPDGTISACTPRSRSQL
jgi:ceramide glucosyltransferase